jgi:HTH-type transcriptional regulator/antitoxin HipB
MTDYSIKTPQQLGAVVAGYRKQQGRSQSEVGSKVGLAQSVVSLLEKSPQRAGLARIFKLLSALDLELVVRPRGKSSRRSEW